MKKKITYILGAGASANALPVAENLINTLDRFINFFERCGREIDDFILCDGSDVILSDLKKDLIASVNEIKDNIVIKKLARWALKKNQQHLTTLPKALTSTAKDLKNFQPHIV